MRNERFTFIKEVLCFIERCSIARRRYCVLSFPSCVSVCLPQSDNSRGDSVTASRYWQTTKRRIMQREA